MSDPVAEGKAKREKTYVTDTTVLMDDPYIHYRLYNCSEVIPLTVIRQLDRHKMSYDEGKAKAARAASREIDEIGGRGDISKGVTVGDNVTVRTTAAYDAIPEGTGNEADDKIVGTAVRLKRKGASDVALLTTDRNMRTVARTYGVEAEPDFGIEALSATAAKKPLTNGEKKGINKAEVRRMEDNNKYRREVERLKAKQRDSSIKNPWRKKKNTGVNIKIKIALIPLFIILSIIAFLIFSEDTSFSAVAVFIGAISFIVLLSLLNLYYMERVGITIRDLHRSKVEFEDTPNKHSLRLKDAHVLNAVRDADLDHPF